MFEKDISQLAKPEIKGRGFIQSGNDIIETQTYFTKPSNDWEFDTDLKMTYNNPVFIEQCKIRGIDFDELNTGWVDQHKLVDEPEIDDEEDDDDEDDFDSSIYKSRDRYSERPKPHTRDTEPSKSKTENTITPKGKEVTFKFGGDKSKKSVETREVDETKTSNTSTKDKVDETKTSNTSTKDKVNAALADAPVKGVTIKLNIDKTSETTVQEKPNVDKTSETTVQEKPKIKLNLKKPLD